MAIDYRGFTYLVQTGHQTPTAIKELKEAWGRSAEILEGTLPRWLIDLAQELEVELNALPDDSRKIERLNPVKEHARQWAESLGNLTAVNILCSLLRASGNDEMAGRLYWGVWRYYRRRDDANRVAYARFNHQIGCFLLEYGYFLGTLRPQMSVRLVAKDAAYIGDPWLDWEKRDNAFQFLNRAVDMKYGVAAPDLAECDALLGNCTKARDRVNSVIRYATENKNPAMFVRGALAVGLIYSIIGAWTDGLKILEFAHKNVIKLGDEPRRARLCSHLVRFLSWKERPKDAENRYVEGLRIAERLGMVKTQWELEIAWGYALTKQGRARDALLPLNKACNFFQSTGRLSTLTRAALDYGHAAMLAGNQEAFDRARKFLKEFETGYAPHVYLWHAEAGLISNDLGLTAIKLENAKKAANEQENHWAMLVVEAMTEELLKRQQLERE